MQFMPFSSYEFWSMPGVPLGGSTVPAGKRNACVPPPIASVPMWQPVDDWLLPLKMVPPRCRRTAV